jgi:hypothetical protein
MKGIVIAQEAHVVQALAPVSTSGGKTAHAFSMKNYQHASILVLRGVQAAQSTSIVVNACTDASGDNPTAIPFNVFKAESANVDVLGPKTAATSSGFQPTATGGTFYVIELDASELPQGSPYVQVVEANGSNADFAAIVAILSGARFAEDQSPTEIS